MTVARKPMMQIESIIQTKLKAASGQGQGDTGRKRAGWGGGHLLALKVLGQAKEVRAWTCPACAHLVPTDSPHCCEQFKGRGTPQDPALIPHCAIWGSGEAPPPAQCAYG